MAISDVPVKYVYVYVKKSVKATITLVNKQCMPTSVAVLPTRQYRYQLMLQAAQCLFSMLFINMFFQSFHQLRIIKVE